MMDYKWKTGARKGGNAQVVGDLLETIRVRHEGRLTADMIVSAARKSKSPLHGYFEWDDSVAAEKHRTTQARELVRSITVRFENSPTQEPVRAFVKIIQGNEAHYTSIEHAMSEADMRSQVLHRALSEYEALGAKYRSLAELSEVFDAVDKASESTRSPRRTAPRRSQVAVVQMA